MVVVHYKHLVDTHTERDAIEAVVALILLLAVKRSLHGRGNLERQLNKLIYKKRIE